MRKNNELRRILFFIRPVSKGEVKRGKKEGGENREEARGLLSGTGKGKNREERQAALSMLL